MIPADRSSGDPLLDPAAQQGRAGDRRAKGYGYGYGYGYGGAQQEESKGLNLREYWRIVRKNKWMILTLVVVVTTIVAVASHKVENQYRASAMVQIGDANQGIALNNGVVIAGSSEKYYKTQLRLLQMPDLVRRVVVELDLEHNPKFFSTKPQTLKAAIQTLVRPSRAQARVTPDAASGGPALPPDPTKPLDEATIARLAPYTGTVAGGLSIEEIPGTQLVNITFQHHDPEIAAKVVNSIAENFVKDNLNQRVSSKSTASDFLQGRIAVLQGQIRAGEERLLNYGRTHEILSMDEKESNPNIERLSQLNNDLVKAQSELQSLEASREAMQQVGVTDVMRTPIAQQDAGAQEISKQLSALRQRRTELLQKYTEEYPEVKSVNDRIAELEADLEKVKQRLTADAETQYQAAVKREAKARAAFEQQRGSMMQQNEASINYKIIQQEVDTNKSFLNTLLGRLKEVDVSAASEVNNVSMKNRAEYGYIIGPDRSSWIFLSFLVSFIGGLGLAFGREYLDQTIKSIEDIDRVAQLPSLGVIPALGAGVKRGARKKLLAENAETGLAAVSADLVTSLHSRSSAAEAYRQLRTSVLLSSAGHPSKLLMVTSSQPREGKTTTAANTAISLAQTGARVLIIDCDLRRPRVHQLLNVDNALGISLYLSGQTEDLDTLIQPNVIDNLSVMPSGPVPPNPAELLGSEQMAKLLDRLALEYDHIVVDTPPVVSFADAVILSTMVDGVILVVRGGFTSRSLMLRSRQVLTDVGAKIYGVVLNDADQKSNESYYYDHYYYADSKDDKKRRAQAN